MVSELGAGLGTVGEHVNFKAIMIVVLDQAPDRFHPVGSGEEC